MADVYVAKTGNDTTGNGSSGNPYLTIGKAASVTANGDTVWVGAGTYQDEASAGASAVLVPKDGVTNVTYRNVPGTRPILDAHGAFYYGVRTWGNTAGFRVEGFEIIGAMADGVRLGGGDNMDYVATGNWIHDIIGTADGQPAGVRLNAANDSTVSHNRIWNIGTASGVSAPTGTGVWALQSRNNIIDGNEIWDVRKEGIRSWTGDLNQITNNRIMRAWTGIAANDDIETLITNNYIAFCDYGFMPKHTSSPATGYALDFWNITPGTELPVRFWHNTIYTCAAGHLAFGNSDEPARNVSVRNNIVEGNGSAYITDWPTYRAGTWVVNDNVYSTDTPPPYLYQNAETYTWGGGAKTFDATEPYDTGSLQGDLGWEVGGWNLDPQLADPAGGDPTPSNAPTGPDLGDSFGTQVGAR